MTQLLVNGQPYEVDNDLSEPLIWVLRDTLGLTGTKVGCSVGLCGVCTVHVDGQATRACITPLEAVVGRAVRTIEGLAVRDTDGMEQLHPVQQAFLDAQVPQCSWCMSGQMMTAAALLAATPQPTRAQIRDALAQNYCRCGCYVRVEAAVLAVAGRQAGGASDV